MKFSESITAEDIKSIAKGRVSRAEGKKSMYMIAVVVVVMAVGLIVLKNSTVGGFGLFIVGVAGFFWYNNGLTKKQKLANDYLVREWQQEMAERQPKQGVVAK
jgi:hypothetical protein